MGERIYIAVIGGGECSEEEANIAEAVGRELGRRGAVLVCGGKGGVMEAACRGAKGAGGTTVGILPEASRSERNPYVDVAIPTGLGSVRNSIVVLSAQAVIAVGGSYGTLSEIAFAGIYGRTVVGLGTWKLDNPRSEEETVIQASSAEEAVSTALAAAERLTGP